MSTFAAPIRAAMVPQYAHDSLPLAKRLMRHYAAGSQGVNVYIINNATVTEVDPDGTTVKWSDVSHCFYGGHAAETITSTEATLLTNAGYTVT